MTYEEALNTLFDSDKSKQEKEEAYRKMEQLINWQRKVLSYGNRIITEDERKKMWALESALTYACKGLASMLKCIDYRFEETDLICESHVFVDAETLEFFIKKKFEVE